MKYLIISALLLFGVLAGCSQSLTAAQWENAIKTCELNGGVDYIIIETGKDNYLQCINGFGKAVTKFVN